MFENWRHMCLPRGQFFLAVVRPIPVYRVKVLHTLNAYVTAQNSKPEKLPNQANPSFLSYLPPSTHPRTKSLKHIPQTHSHPPLHA